MIGTSAARVADAGVLLCAVLFGFLGPRLARTLRPQAAARLLALGAICSLCSGFVVLCSLSLPLWGRDDLLVDYMHWSPAALDKDSGTGMGVAVLATAAMLAMVLRGVICGLRARAARSEARAILRSVGTTAGGLVVLPGPEVAAYAIEGRPGLIVLSEGALRLLSAGERRAVIVHELTHLRYHHVLYLRWAVFAGRAYPVLRRIHEDVAYTLERWSDEVAAAATSRKTVAAALMRLAGASNWGGRPSAALAVVSTGVWSRIEALQEEPPGLSSSSIALVFIMCAAALAAAAVSTTHAWDVARAAMTLRRHLTRHG